jgi:hypothetical protein
VSGNARDDREWGGGFGDWQKTPESNRGGLNFIFLKEMNQI